MAPGDAAGQAAVVPSPTWCRCPTVAPTVVAAIGMSGIAAWMALTWRGGLAPGETVIVLGAGGVVGQAAVALARLSGAGRVIAVARSPGQPRALAAGADEVVALHTDDVTDLALLARCCRRRARGPGDRPGVWPAGRGRGRCPRPGGRLVNIGGSASEHAPLDSSTIRSRSLRVLGYTNNELTREQKAAAVTTVAQHAADGQLEVAHEVVALEDAPDAWDPPGRGQDDGPAGAGALTAAPMGVR